MARFDFNGGGQRFVITEPTTINDVSTNGWGYLQNVGNCHVMAHTKFSPSFEQMSQDGSAAGMFISPGGALEVTGAASVHVDTADGIYPVIIVLSEKV